MSVGAPLTKTGFIPDITFGTARPDKIENCIRVANLGNSVEVTPRR